MTRYIISEGSKTAWGGRTVRVELAADAQPRRCPRCNYLRKTACSSKVCPLALRLSA